MKAGRYGDFWSKVIGANDLDACWLWAGALSKGYGVVRIDGAIRKAHVVTYEQLHGPVPPGLVLDHTCHNLDPMCLDGDACLHRRCVNPLHLEAVTQLLNVQRGKNSLALSNRAKARLLCPAGHEYDGRTATKRTCRQCAAAAARKYRRRKTAGLVAPRPAG